MTDLPTTPPEDLVPTIQRVVLFVSRRAAPERELLLQDYGDGHLRLPVETVATDETAEELAVRLAKYRAQSAGVALDGLLDSAIQRLPAEQRCAFRSQFLRTAPFADATLLRFMLERGTVVDAFELQNGYTRIVYHEFETVEGDFALTTRRAGWISTNALCERIEHLLIHVLLLESSVEATQLSFAMRRLDHPSIWVALSKVAVLPADQQVWFDLVRERLDNNR